MEARYNRVGRNELCPCGSGEKYKNCCWNKSFRWVRDSEGNIYRKIPLTPADGSQEALGMTPEEVQQMIKDGFKDAESKFRERFGREPGPEDPIFAGLGHPEHVEAWMVDLMKQANIPPEFTYAFEKTGRIVTESNKKFIPDTELQEWYDAVREGLEKLKRGELDEGKWSF